MRRPKERIIFDNLVSDHNGNTREVAIESLEMNDITNPSVF